MLHVVRPDGTIEEVIDAVAGAVEGTVLVCRDAAGQVVRTFDHVEVIMFGTLESVRKAAAELPSFRHSTNESDD